MTKRVIQPAVSATRRTNLLKTQSANRFQIQMNRRNGRNREEWLNASPVDFDGIRQTRFQSAKFAILQIEYEFLG